VNCGLAHPTQHDVMSSTERKRGDFWYFVQDCFKINSTSFQLFAIFFQLHQKCPNFTRLTEGSSVKEVSQRQRVNKYKSRPALTISARLNHAQRENNRSSFGTFSGPNLMLKLTSRRGPDGQNSRAGFGPRARLCRLLV